MRHEKGKLNFPFFFDITFMNELYYKAINFISDNNPSNALPYHGIDHLYSVFQHCEITIKEADITEPIQETELLIAALFHDYNHSGGKLTDFENIQNAILGVIEFHKINPTFNLEYVKFLIRCTEFPYTVTDSKQTIESKILRDADLCYLLSDLSIVKLYTGLRTEFNQTLIEFYNNQLNFLNNVEYYIEYNKNIWKNLKPLKIKELELLKENV